MDAPQLIVCGSIAIDRIMNFTGLYRELIKPEKIHALSISPLLDKLENTPGGVGANIAFNLARLGERPVLLGSVGLDAKQYIADLSTAGVDTSHIHFSKRATASFNVITDSEDSQVGGFYQGAMADSESVSFKPWIKKNVLAVISAYDPEAMNRQVEECKTSGMRLIYDPGQQVANPTTDLQAGINAAEVVFVNDYELQLLDEKLGLGVSVLKSQMPLLITTLGKNGSIITGKNLSSPLKISIAKPKHVVDPTGAGDAYRAGFLYGYLREWDLRTCGQLGATIASFIVEHQGTQHAFSKPEVLQRYYDNFKEELML
ncbi:MAG TPA: carbohydrate kinase family protein [Candidatus Saccharimonadales bacterium]|nr:carbohydrate kinase family protein [Candidatus Saccharimonadales bacterium]